MKKTDRKISTKARGGMVAKKTECQEIFREFLRGKGLKLTKERQVILEEVFKYHGHFDIDELYLKLRRKGLKISKASIYRTVPLLLECGLVEEVKTTGRQAFFEHTYGHEHHDHIICLSCGKVIEFYSSDIEKLQEEICRKNRFKSVRHILEIQGYCRDCARA